MLSSVLPVKVPNILINGAEGIAVGMATSIPPHNLGEIIDGVIAYMKNPDITTEEMMEYIPGPDFPTGGIVINKDELVSIYESGNGKIKLRGKVEIEPIKGGKERIVITEIPYTMIGANIGKFLNDVYSLVETKKTSDIVDISNQSSKAGIRIVIDLKKGADAQNLCLNGLCFAYELLEPLEENPQADCPQLFVLDAGSMGVLRGEYYFEGHQLHLSVDGQEKVFSPVIAPAAQVIFPQAPTTVPSAKS